jgi:voltage-gated potassium channel
MNQSTEEPRPYGSPLKRRVHDILHNPAHGDRVAFGVQLFLAAVILANTVAIIIFTLKDLDPVLQAVLGAVAFACILIFAIEYVLRVWSCTLAGTFMQRTRERLHYMTGFYPIIDFLSILPLFLPFDIVRHLSLLRFLRLISIFKLGRYSRMSTSVGQLKRIFFHKREFLSLLAFALVFNILFFSTLLYMAEYDAQPDKFSSIPASMWCAVMTVTTVGYGDIYPVTVAGKVITGLVTITGVILLAVPAAILAAGFMEERERMRNAKTDQHAAIHSELELVERAAMLRDKGILSEKEFEEYKARIRGK